MRSLTQSSANSFICNPITVPLPPALQMTDTTPGLHPSERHLVVPFPETTHKANPFFNIDNNPYSLSMRTRHHVNQAIQKSLADSTFKRYTGSINQFIRFCDKERVPESLRFPADEFVLCAFAASSLGKHAGGTPRSRISALKAWHMAHNLEWKGSPRLRYVLNGVHNSAPKDSKRPLRPPINARMLSQLVMRLDLNLPLDAAVAACATTAFWGQCRLGELLSPSIHLSSSDSESLPTRSDFKRSLSNPQSCILHLPRTKTHRHGEDVILVDQLDPINSIALLKNHIRVNNISSSTHLFSITSSGGHTSLSKNLFLRRCNDIWSSLGYPRTTGHCFRIGGTTELLIAGTPPDVVKATGRWSSESFLRYWRSLDALAPQHIRNIHSRKHKCSLRLR